MRCLAPSPKKMLDKYAAKVVAMMARAGWEASDANLGNIGLTAAGKPVLFDPGYISPRRRFAQGGLIPHFADGGSVGYKYNSGTDFFSSYQKAFAYQGHEPVGFYSGENDFPTRLVKDKPQTALLNYQTLQQQIERRSLTGADPSSTLAYLESSAQKAGIPFDKMTTQFVANLPGQGKGTAAQILGFYDKERMKAEQMHAQEAQSQTLTLRLDQIPAKGLEHFISQDVLQNVASQAIRAAQEKGLAISAGLLAQVKFHSGDEAKHKLGSAEFVGLGSEIKPLFAPPRAKKSVSGVGPSDHQELAHSGETYLPSPHRVGRTEMKAIRSQNNEVGITDAERLDPNADALRMELIAEQKAGKKKRKAPRTANEEWWRDLKLPQKTALQEARDKAISEKSMREGTVGEDIPTEQLGLLGARNKAHLEELARRNTAFLAGNLLPNESSKEDKRAAHRNILMDLFASRRKPSAGYADGGHIRWDIPAAETP